MESEEDEAWSNCLLHVAHVSDERDEEASADEVGLLSKEGVVHDNIEVGEQGPREGGTLILELVVGERHLHIKEYCHDRVDLSQEGL